MTTGTPRNEAESPAGPLDRFRTLVGIPTISRSDESLTDWAEFDRFTTTVQSLYPLLHAALDRETVGEHSLLYRWVGTHEGPPAVLMAHMDVVPATDEGWDYPPFGAVLVGEGADQELWGRGTLDDKGALVCILEAIERLVARGHRPRNDVYLSFGHNEETAGDGATQAVALLAGRGIRPSFVLDEGGAIVEGVFPTVDAPVAFIGVSEKGITTALLTVEQVGGHASTPPRVTATARLAKAIVRLNRRPFPARLSPVTREMVSTLGHHARGPLKAIFRGVRFTAPLLAVAFARLGDETNAMIRTTQAVTRLSGSDGANVLAERATATVNIRVAVGSTVGEAMDHVKRAIRDDAVKVTILEESEPSPVSPTTGEAWSLLTNTIGEIYPTVVVAPYIQLGASDSRRYTAISDHVYRFTPFEMSSDERATLHAKNERIHVATWLRGIDFYETLASRL